MNFSSLGWRGATIVAIPLIYQLVLSVVFLSQFQNILTEVERQSQSREFVNKCYALESKIIECFCDLRMSTDEHGMLNQESSRKDLNEVNKRAQAIVSITEKDPSKKDITARLKTTFLHTDGFFNWFIAEQSKGEISWKVRNNDFPIRLLAISEEFLTVFTELTALEEKKLSPEATLAEWEKTKKLLHAAMAIIVLLAAALAGAYALTIKRPLNRIGETCRRIAMREPAMPPLTGRDELSELDRLFHALGRSLDKATSDEKAMIENARDLICSLNSNGEFLKANSYTSELLGLETGELCGSSLMDICGPDDTMTADDELRTSCSTSDMRTFDLSLLRKDGQPVDTRWSCVWSEHDQELFAVVHDISEEKNVERLKQDFVDMISHDLRSPLTSMLGSLSMIAAGAKGPLPEAADKEVHSAVRNVERLVEFINDLLDFQKLKAGRMQLELAPVNLKEVVAEALDMVKGSVENKELEIILPENSATVRGDNNKLTQLTMNLLANAIRFSPPKGKIKIEFQQVENSLVEMRVIDSGPGVPEGYREQIFDAFAQVPSQKMSKEGTGLGLAICKLVIDAHGGEIGVRGNSIDDLMAQSSGKHDDNFESGGIFWIRLHLG